MDEIMLMVRYLINDVDGATYSDSRLRTAALIGAKYVNPLFENYYTISLSGSGSISPDPSQAFMNLTTLKTACLISTGEAKISAGQGIAIKDGSSSLDLKGVSSSKSDMMKSYCEMYEEAKNEYLAAGDGTNGPPGAAILSPINRGEYGQRRIQNY